MHADVEAGETPLAYLNSMCSVVSSSIIDFGEAIGFIIRSTNVRNSFEWHWPLQRMADKIFHHRKKIVVSAEWKFNPHTHIYAVSEGVAKILDNFAFIGLPAYEARNPLIIPLAGHELGHSLWRDHEMDDNLYLKVRDVCKSKFATQPSPPHDDVISAFSDKYCKRQIQEMYCDFLGVRLFGISFLHAFQYFVRDIVPAARADYPTPIERATYISWYATRLELSVPGDYIASFEETEVDGVVQEQGVRSIDRLCIGEAREDFKEEIADAIDNVAEDVLLPDVDVVSSILKDFSLGRPSASPGLFSEVIEAGWLFYLSDPGMSGEKFSNISNCLLKTVEVWELKERRALYRRGKK